ncbi:DMT family transporter [Cellulomonas sp. SG140]|uniref:DMT family transporter n=1 Tax=Cellulomonas sp. SG140 TaxID=2976536 RepID=UPI0021E8FE8B|nr:DMT family transporter [Cellulomonas sp. SG140]
MHGDTGAWDGSDVVRHRPRPARMLWVTAVLGGCFVAIRWGLRDAPVLWFAALRAVLAGVVLLAVGAVQHRPVPVGVRAWTKIAVLGLVNVTVAFAAMFYGAASGATGSAAVLANAQPLLILLPAWWLFGERLSARTTTALAVGFSGLLLVALPGGGGRGALVSLLAAAGVTVGTLLARRLGDVDLVVASGWHLAIGGIVLVGLATAVDGSPAIAWTPRFVGSLSFLALLGTAATTVVWFAEARRSRMDALTAWTFLTPVFGIVLSFMLLGERPRSWTLIGLLVVLLALRLATTPTSVSSGRQIPDPRSSATPAQ